MGRNVLNRRKRSRGLGVLVALAMITSLALPLSGVAQATPRAALGGAPADVAIDCDDESGNDSETLDAGEEPGFGCIVTEPDGSDPGNVRDPLDDVTVDAENLDGANDPDSSDDAGSPDYNDICETDNDGECTFFLDLDGDDDEGSADLCFWADDDGDNVFNPDGSENDGGDCLSETAATEDVDGIDVLSVTWVAGGDDELDPDDPRTLDCDDESGNDTAIVDEGVGETYTCTLTDPDDGDADDDREPVDDVSIDVENLDGANDEDDSSASGTADFNDECETDADGECEITLDAEEDDEGEAEFCFWADTNDDDDFDPAGSASDGGGCNSESPETEDTDIIDVVSLTWGEGADVSDLLLDCDDETGNDTATNQAGVGEGYGCILSEPDGSDAGNVRDPVEDVTIDGENLDGANDPDNSDEEGSADYDDLCETDNDGECTFILEPDGNEAGEAEICFWADTNDDDDFDPDGDESDGGGCTDESPATEDSDSIDVVELIWETSGARTIDCEPESAQVPVGDEHDVECLVEDAEGDPVGGVEVVFTETGDGEIVSDDRADTDEDGVATVTVSSSDPGSQTVLGTIGEDLLGEPDTDDCDRDEDDPDGAPEGVCADSVTVTWGDVPPPCAGISNAIVGTEGNDNLVGTPGTDFICALGGDDVVDGLGGNDLILLGAGNDTAVGGGGSDRLRGGPGDDVLRGGADTDLVIGGAGGDRLRGGGGNDVLRGKAGNDTLLGGGGSDRLNGGRGNDFLNGGPGTDALFAGAGFDTCRDGRRNNVLRGCEA